MDNQITLRNLEACCYFEYSSYSFSNLGIMILESRLWLFYHNLDVAIPISHIHARRYTTRHKFSSVLTSIYFPNVISLIAKNSDEFEQAVRQSSLYLSSPNALEAQLSPGSPLENLVIGDHCCNHISQFNQLEIGDLYLLRTIHIGCFSFVNCRKFILQDLHLLTTCIIKSYSFANHVFSTIHSNPLRTKYNAEANAQSGYSSTTMVIEEEEEYSNDVINNLEDEDMSNEYSVTERLRKLVHGEIGFSESDDYESDGDASNDSIYFNLEDEEYGFYSDDTDDPYCQEQDGFVNLCDDVEDSCIQDTLLLDLVEKSNTKADSTYDYSTDRESRFSFCYGLHYNRSIDKKQEDCYALEYPDFNPEETFWTCLDGEFVIHNCSQLQVISLGAFSFARYRDLSVTCRHFHFHFQLQLYYEYIFIS